MFRWDNWVLWFIAGCVLLIGLVVLLGGEPATGERDTPREQPTAASQGEETASSRAAPTPRPRATPRSTPIPNGLGVSLSDFKKAFEGHTFKYAPLNDGRDRWMVESEGVVVEVIGPWRSVEEATLGLPVANAIAMGSFIIRFFEAAAPGWETGLEWVGDNLEEALWDEIDISIGDRVVNMSASEQHGLLWIVVTPR